ncbi:MAG: cupin domain-containing protein, partial [Candidatus Hydrogenedentales bacterium]
ENTSNALVKTDAFEAILMHLPAGKTVPPHAVEGPIIVHCLEGSVNFPVDGQPRPMRAGDWMHLAAGQSHAVEALEESRLLVTILFPHESGYAQTIH